MKILQFLPYHNKLHKGGVQSIGQTLSNNINKISNYKIVNVLSDIKKNSYTGNIEELEKDNIFIPSFEIVHSFPLAKIWLKSFRQQIKKIKNEKADIILTHTRFFPTTFLGGIIAKLNKIKRIHVEHGSGFVDGHPLYIKILAWIYDQTLGRLIFAVCDKIITISDTNQSFVKKLTKKTPTTIYNPIEFKAKEKMSNQIPHIGYVGRLVEAKGVNIMIKALKQIENRKRNCTIVGDGSQRKKLEDLVKKLGLENRIKFVGADDRSNRLHKFDLFVNPSYQEGLPTTVVEALMAKCIVVATDVGGTREISNKNDLIIVNSGSIESLKGGIEKAFYNLDNSGLSYDLVIEKFGVKNSIEKYLKVFK